MFVTVLVFLAGVVGISRSVLAASCPPPPSDLGRITGTVSIPAGQSGTYRVQSRLTAPNARNNSYLLEIDGNKCFTVGDRTIPANTLTNIDYQDGQTTNKIDVTLAVGTHNLKIYGREADIKLDRINFIKTTHAATVYKFNAEAGTTSGNAQKLTYPDADGGKVVQLSVAGPSRLETVTGGNSIALRWDTIPDPKVYNVYRNGKKIATTAPDVTNYSNMYGNRYYDATAVAGTLYKYTVQSVDKSNISSILSPVTKATKPVQTSLIPTIILDSSRAPEFDDWMANHAKPTIQTWYPKIADSIVRNAYPVPSTLTVLVDVDYNGVAYTSGTTIGIGDEYLRDHLDDMGMLIHEATHVIQQAKDAALPGVVVEGGADWTREILFHDREQTPPRPYVVYDDGYSGGAYFLQWIRDSAGEPDIVYNLTVAAHDPAPFSYDLFEQFTGTTVQELWYAMTGRKTSAMEQIIGQNNECVDVPNYDTTNGKTMQIVGCKVVTAQHFIMGFNPDNSGSGDLHVLGKCIETGGSGVSSGDPVRIWDCNGGVYQQWKPQPNGTLKNIASNKCLQPVGGSTQDNTLLEIRICNEQPYQKWSVPDTFLELL